MNNEIYIYIAIYMAVVTAYNYVGAKFFIKSVLKVSTMTSDTKRYLRYYLTCFFFSVLLIFPCLLIFLVFYILKSIYRVDLHFSNFMLFWIIFLWILSIIPSHRYIFRKNADVLLKAKYFTGE